MNTYSRLKEKFIKIFNQMIKTGIVKYGLVGGINTLITGVILFVLMNGFGVSFKISNVVGYVAGFFNSFIMNKFWTFKANQTSTLRQFIRFTAVFAVCYLIQLRLVVFLVENLSVNKNISQLIGMVFYTLIGFLFNKLFTFKR